MSRMSKNTAKKNSKQNDSLAQPIWSILLLISSMMYHFTRFILQKIIEKISKIYTTTNLSALMISHSMFAMLLFSIKHWLRSDTQAYMYLCRCPICVREKNGKVKKTNGIKISSVPLHLVSVSAI